MYNKSVREFINLFTSFRLSMENKQEKHEFVH